MEYFGAVLVLIYFFIFVFSYWYVMDFLVLPRAALLDSIEAIHSPPMYPLPGFDLVGFAIPLVLSLSCLYARRKDIGVTSKTGFSNQIKKNVKWFLALIVAISLSYFIPGLIDGGHTDLPLMLLISLFVGSRLRNGGLLDRVLFSVPLGFAIGLVSDIQSTVFFIGIFGAGGWIDGDFMETIFLPFGVLVAMLLLNRQGFLVQTGPSIRIQNNG